MKILRNLISLAAGVSVGALAYRFRKELSQTCRIILGKIKQDKSVECDNPPFDTFSVYAERFSGMYEPLYKAANSADEKKLLKLIEQWGVRVASQSSSELSSWWNLSVEHNGFSLLQKAEAILSMIEKNGIIRDSRKLFKVTTNDFQLYRNIDNEELSLESKVNVITPCWYINSNPIYVVEQGYVENQN